MSTSTGFGPNGFSPGRVHCGPQVGSTDYAWKLMRAKEFFHPGGGNGTFSRSVHVGQDFGVSRQGGCLMYMFHGWNHDRSYGYVSWQNPGNSSGITSTFLHQAYNNNVTIGVSHDSDSTVTFNFSGAHVNGHGFHFVVWCGE